MGLRRLSKAQRIEALHQAFHDELGAGAMIPPALMKRVLFRGLGLVSTQTWQATMEALDDVGLMTWIKGEGLVIAPPLAGSPIEAVPLHA